MTRGDFVAWIVRPNRLCVEGGWRDRLRLKLFGARFRLSFDYGCTGTHDYKGIGWVHRYGKHSQLYLSLHDIGRFWLNSDGTWQGDCPVQPLLERDSEVAALQSTVKLLERQLEELRASMEPKE